MTGLDPSKDLIVEVATLITDDDLNIVAEGPDLVIHTNPEDLARIDDFVRQMHTKSGLLKKIEESEVSADEARDRTLAFLKEHISASRSVPLCGNSIGMDRRFLATHWPEIEEYLHYRSIDVSTIKELSKRWFPKAAKGAPQKMGAHRALDDIRESVAELAYYRAEVFKAPS